MKNFVKNFAKKIFSLIIALLIICIIVCIFSFKPIKGYILLGNKHCTCKYESHSSLGGAIWPNECKICKNDFTTFGSSKELCNSCAESTNRCDNCGKLEK